MAIEFMLSSGIHQGATFALADELVIIGADSSCDICLSDAGLAPRHLALVRRGNGVSIRGLEGQVSVNGQTLAQNTPALLLSDAEIVLGDTGVRMQFSASTDLLPPTQSLPPQPNSPKATRLARHKLSLIAVSALLMTGVLAAGLSARPLETSASDVPDIHTVRALLQRENLAQQIELTKTAYGVELSGVINAASAAKLREVLANTSVTNAVITDEELIEQIHDVFRTHGYEADVTYVGNAQARIENLDETHERVQRAAARARADIPLLSSLSFAAVGTNQPPERPAPYRNGSGRRFTLHLNGETAYLASEDGSRYFTGSMLPDGYAIRRITERAVLMDREGQLAWRGF